MMITRNPHRTFEDMPIAQIVLPHRSGNFGSDFLQVVSFCIDNYRNDRSGRSVLGMPLEPYLVDAAKALGRNPSKSAMVEYSDSIVKGAISHWDWLYEHLEDWDSKALLLDVLAYRSIGWRHVKMPLDNTNYWNAISALGELLGKSPVVKISHELEFWLVDLSEQGYRLKVLSEPHGLFNEFVYSQYRYRGRRTVVGPNPGDYVLDCGACYGGTTLYFADAVGPEGRVISFEFFPDNVTVFKRNIGENEAISQRIDLCETPVWHTAKKSMFIEYAGPATQVYEADEPKDGNHYQVISTTIDAACKDLPRVDFIKADIEGSELGALVGAIEILRKFRPTLAICVYHKLRDFYEIPEWLDSLNLGYRFYLQHGSIHGDETVLFADARNGESVDRFQPTHRVDPSIAMRQVNLREALLEANIQLAQIKASSSWRLTEPLRRLAGKWSPRTRLNLRRGMKAIGGS